MRRLRLILAGLVMFLGAGLIAPSPASAAYANSAGCNAGYHFYVHAPYPQNGAYYAWAECVPLNVNASWPDANLGEGVRIDRIDNYMDIGPTRVGVNYESWRTIGAYQWTVVAAAPCVAHYYLTQVGVWVNSTTQSNVITSWVYRNGVC